MTKILQAVRGMNDILPVESCYWAFVEAQFRACAKAYAYEEIRLPIVEPTELFARGIGEVTDIVEKEMYTFLDRNGDSLSLRPEGTAGCVRAGIEHGLLYHQIQRFWYSGPMFRHERPQKGRYRQFYQLGIEAFGMADPAADVEVILFSRRFLAALGLLDQVTCQINSLGNLESRAQYRHALVTYFELHGSRLDEDSQRRLYTNPLRILDSKNPAMKELIAAAPKLIDHLDDASIAHFSRVKQLLDAAGMRYEINPRLVRGLDYYSDTVFEWVTTDLGAQGTVCAGGRYDRLVELLGGAPTSAVGLAAGIERLVLLLQAKETRIQSPDLCVLSLGEKAQAAALSLVENLREALPSLSIEMNLSGSSLKNQFKRADKLQAKLALVLGAEEYERKTVSLKYLRETRTQRDIAWDDLIAVLQEELL